MEGMGKHSAISHQPSFRSLTVWTGFDFGAFGSWGQLASLA